MAPSLYLLSLILASASGGVSAVPRHQMLRAQATQDVQSLCNSLGPFLPLPEIRSADFCATSGLDHNLKKCNMLDFVEGALVNITGQLPSTCRAGEQTEAIDVSPSGVQLPYPLADKRPLPKSLDSSLLTTEGASIYFVWKTLLNFNLWAGCAATDTPHTVTPGVPVTGNPKQDLLLSKGWTVHSTHWQPDGTGSQHNGRFWPFAAVLYKGGDVIVVVRGSQTQQDWKSDFNYNTSSASLLPGQPAFDLPGNVHQGFAAIATSLWPGLQSALQNLVASPAGVTNVYVAGHSLGAGVATLLSYGVQTYLQQMVGPSVNVAALLFAVPNAGDATFAQRFDTVVNARRLPFAFDIIPQLACASTMVGCPDAIVPTGTDLNGGLWQYTPVGGSIVLEAAHMPQQPRVWGLLNRVHPCQMKRFFEATHVCSYNCYWSQFVGDNNNMCRLWTRESATGTFCTGFPATEGRYEYPYLL